MNQQKNKNQRGLMIRGRRVESSPNRIRPKHDFVLDHQALVTKEDSNFWVQEVAASSLIGGNNANDGAKKCSPPSPFDNKRTKSIHLVMSLDKGDFSDKFIAGVHAQAARIGGGRDCYYCRR
jgi:hypothetical protein